MSRNNSDEVGRRDDAEERRWHEPGGDRNRQERELDELDLDVQLDRLEREVEKEWNSKIRELHEWENDLKELEQDLRTYAETLRERASWLRTNCLYCQLR